MVKRNTGLILALDVTLRGRAVEIAEETFDLVDAFKIGYPLVLATGIGVITELSSYAPVIADFKLADIPYTNGLICHAVFQAGAAAVIAHTFTGADSLKAVLEEAAANQGEVYAVTEMSHPGAARFLQPQAEALARLAVELGVHGLIAPATNLVQLAKIRVIARELKLLSPGVGAQGGSPREVVMAGADQIIVGRSIYNSKNPRSAAESIVGEIERACEEKTRLKSL